MICLLIKKLNPVVNELFIVTRKLNIYLVFITQSYVTVPKGIRINSPHYFVLKIQNNRELHQTKFYNSSDSSFQDFMNFYKKMYCKNIFFLVDRYYSFIQ